MEQKTINLDHFRRAVVIGDRPPQMKTNTNLLVFNAPRPLYGTEIPWGDEKTGEIADLFEGNNYEWRGDFVHGVFYAGVDPNDDRAEWCVQRNQDLDATLIGFIDQQQHEQAVIMWAKKYLADFNKEFKRDVKLSDYTLAQWDEMNRNHVPFKIVGEWLPAKTIE